MNRKLHSILLVEDDEATNFISQMVIKKMDCANHVHVAWNGAEALDYLKNCNNSSNGQPDLILLDINMPALNGWEFLDEYHKLGEQEKGRVVVVMLTTSMNPDDHKRAISHPDVSGFRNKPLTTGLMEDILDAYFNR
jgi:CheY-like chemotaxis protein